MVYYILIYLGVLKYYKFATDKYPEGAIELYGCRVEQVGYGSSCFILKVPNHKNEVILHLHGCSDEDIESFKLVMDLSTSRSPEGLNYQNSFQSTGTTDLNNDVIYQPCDTPQSGRFLLTRKYKNKLLKEWVQVSENGKMHIYESIDSKEVKDIISLKNLTFNEYDRDVIKCHKYIEEYQMADSDSKKYRKCIELSSDTDKYNKFTIHCHGYDQIEVFYNSIMIKSILNKFIKSELKDVKSIFNNSITLDNFVHIKQIGEGAYGKVMLTKSLNDSKVYATKIIENNKVEMDEEDFKTLENIIHPFLVKLHYLYRNEKKTYCMMDYCAGGNLYEYIRNSGRFSEAQAVFYISEIIEAISELHNNNIIYRDLKPENILLDELGHVKICDFGMCEYGKSNEKVQSNIFCGSIEYVSPEVLNRKTYSVEVDWWSLGCLYYELITGHTPFISSSEQQLYTNINNGKILYPTSMSSESMLFISELLEVDPTKRLGYNNINEIKDHPLVKKYNINWKHVINKRLVPPIIPREGEISPSNDYILQDLSLGYIENLTKNKTQTKLYINTVIN